MWDTYLTGAILSHKLEEIEYRPIRNEDGVVVDVEVMTPDVRVLWPQKWNIRALMLEKLASLDLGVWIREKLNDLRALAGKIFKREAFSWFDDDDLRQIRTNGGWERIIQAWDTAYEENRQADYSVCVTVGLWKRRVYLLDVYRKQMELPQLQAAIVSQFRQWQPEKVLIENRASGKSVYQVLKQESGVPVAEVDPGGKDKVSRARSVTVFVENGRVLLRSGALWLDGLLGELTMFPESEHDDQVDALVYGVLELLLEGEKAVVTSSVVGREAVERMFG